MRASRASQASASRLHGAEAALQDLDVAGGQALQRGGALGGRAGALLTVAAGVDLLLQRPGVGAA